jgi:hypothetical protein
MTRLEVRQTVPSLAAAPSSLPEGEIELTPVGKEYSRTSPSER